MSLGAIDFGLVVDSSVVMVENCVRHLGARPLRSPEARRHPRRGGRGAEADPVRRADHHDRLPADPDPRRGRGEALPADGPDGHLRPARLDGPVADAHAGARLARPPAEDVGARRPASTASPTGSSSRSSGSGSGSRGRRSSSSGAITIGATLLGLTLGSEFVPRLNEGSIVINTVRLASVSLEESLRYGTQIERILLEEFPDEIDAIWTRTGTAEVATDPMGFEVSDVFITLKPRERVEAGEDAGRAGRGDGRGRPRRSPACGRSTRQPIEMRINEMVAGIRADLGIKLFGDDLEVLKAKAAEIERVVEEIPGAADVTTEQITGLPGPPRRGRPAGPLPLRRLGRAGARRRRGRWAASPSARSSEPGRRFPLVVRLPMSYRDDPTALEKILIPTASGQTAPPHPARPPGRDDRPLDHPARVGRAADRRPGERPGPRHRLVRRGGPGADRPRGGAPARLHRSSGAGSSRTSSGPSGGSIIVVPLALALDPEPALPDVPLGPRRPDDLQRRALRPGRRRLRPLALGHAVHDLGGRRLRRPGRGVDARRA